MKVIFRIAILFLVTIMVSTCGNRIPEFSESRPYALEIKRVRSYYDAQSVQQRLNEMGVETYLKVLQDPDNADDKWYVLMTGAEKELADIATLQKAVSDLVDLETVEVVNFDEVAQLIVEFDEDDITEREKIIADRPDLPESVHQLVEKFPANPAFKVRHISLHNFPLQQLGRGSLQNYYDTSLDLPRGITKKLVANNTTSYAEVIFEDNLYGDQVTIDVLKLKPTHQLDQFRSKAMDGKRHLSFPALPEAISANFAAKVLATGRYMTESADPLELTSFRKFYGYKVLIEPRRDYLRTYMLLVDEEGEYAIFSQSTDKTDEEMLAYLEDFGRGEGMLAYNEFYNTFYTIPKCLPAEDIFLGYSSSILDGSYAASKGYANWAKAMVGHSQSSAHFYNTRLQKNWKASAFDLLTIDKKDYIYTDMYGNADYSATRQPLKVRDLNGFFVSAAMGYRKYQEVNYGTEGRHVMAVGGFGIDRETLELRASLFQSGEVRGTAPCDDDPSSSGADGNDGSSDDDDDGGDDDGPPEPTGGSSGGTICGETAMVYDFNSSAPNYYQYEMPRVLLCDPSDSPRCKRAFAYYLMLEQVSLAAPTRERGQLYNCRRTKVAYESLQGNIITTLEEGNFTLYNYALPDHPFYPSYVRRQVVEEDGKIYILTEGRGTAAAASQADNAQLIQTTWSQLDSALLLKVQERI